MKHKKRAWLYIRTTHPDKADSPSRQIMCVRRFAREQGLTVVGETVAIENGRFLERDGLSKVSDAVDGGLVDMVVVQNPSRIARTSREMWKYRAWLRKNGVKLLSADEISDADVDEECAYIVDVISDAIKRDRQRMGKSRNRVRA